MENELGPISNMDNNAIADFDKINFYILNNIYNIKKAFIKNNGNNTNFDSNKFKLNIYIIGKKKSGKKFFLNLIKKKLNLFIFYIYIMNIK